MSDKTVQYTIELVDKWAKPMAQFTQNIDAVNRKSKTAFGSMDKSLGDHIRNLERYKQKQLDAYSPKHQLMYGKLIQATEAKIKALAQSTGVKLPASLDHLNAKLQNSAKSTTSFFDKIKNNPMLSLGVTAVAGAVYKLGSEAILASSKFEKFNITLRTMLGSKGAARERMEEYANIAAATPFQIEQVVDAGNQLQALGRYSKDNLIALGDLAAASGKPLEQVMNAYAKLGTGQKGEAVNMFRDLLISSDDWTNATGKGIKKNGELAASTEEMIAALPQILKQKGFFGMMEQQSQTTEGRISNLNDSLEMLKVNAGDKLKPTFDRLLSSTSSIIANMNKWVAVPTHQKIATEKAELNALVGVITDANTGEQVRSDLLAQLQQQYPEFLKGLDLENVKNEELRQKLAAVNKEYENKMKLAAMQGLVTDEETRLQELYSENARLEMAKQATSNVVSLERAIGDKFGVKDATTYKNGVASYGTSFSEKLEKKKGVMEKRMMNNPSDTEASEFMNLYSQYKGWTSVQSKQAGTFETGGALNEKLTENRKEIASLQGTVDLYKQNLGNEERKDLLSRARTTDINDKTTVEKFFGKNNKLKSEFDNIRGTDFESISSDQWIKLSEIMSGNAKGIVKSSGGVSGGSLSSDAISKASADITGGGKNVKQFNISLESLIAQNNNYFKEGENPKRADGFMHKLSEALQYVINDANYTAQ